MLADCQHVVHVILPKVSIHVCFKTGTLTLSTYIGLFNLTQIRPRNYVINMLFPLEKNEESLCRTFDSVLFVLVPPLLRQHSSTVTKSVLGSPAFLANFGPAED